MCAAILAAQGCAYTLDTGNRKLDRGCLWWQNTTAPIGRAFVRTGEFIAGAAACVAGGAAEAAADSECGDGEVPKHHNDSPAGQSGGGDTTPSQPKESLCDKRPAEIRLISDV